jgi:gamma-glutamylaminecyclotransferase
VTKQTHRVFVYGTLKRGYNNHYLLGRSRYMGKSATRSNYLMVSGGFPVILPLNPGQSVAGELYHVDDATLARLDQLEGVPYMYTREVIDALERGKPVKAYVYVGNPTTWMVREGLDRGAYTHTNARGELDWYPRG